MAAWDAIVCGGGMSGQVLAAELAGPRGPLDRVLLVDDGSHPVGRRTWAFWAARPTVIDEAVTGRWRRLAVHAGGLEMSLDPRPYDYRLVDGAVLARTVAERVVTARHTLEVRTGRVEEVADRGTHAVAVVDGEPLVASWVFDSRPPPPPRPGEARMRFIGRVAESPGDTFDPATATFLDFRVAQDPDGRGVRFAYVLPLDRTRALVDVVTLTTGGDDPGERNALPCYLGRVLGVGGPVVSDHEAGEIALRQEPLPPRTGRVVPVGRRGGLLKPSTGFAVDRILRDGEAIAGSLRRRGHPHARPRPAGRHRWLDRVLLEVLDQDPASLEQAFAALFARNPPARVLRFLDEDTTLAQEAALIATLPRGPFLAAAGRAAGRTGPG